MNRSPFYPYLLREFLEAQVPSSPDTGVLEQVCVLESGKKTEGFARCYKLTSNGHPLPQACMQKALLRKGGYPGVRENTCWVAEVREWGLSSIRTNFLVLRTKGIPRIR